MTNIEVEKIIEPVAASDGAGVKLKRSFFALVNKLTINHFVMDHIIKNKG